MESNMKKYTMLLQIGSGFFWNVFATLRTIPVWQSPYAEPCLSERYSGQVLKVRAIWRIFGSNLPVTMRFFPLVS